MNKIVILNNALCSSCSSVFELSGQVGGNYSKPPVNYSSSLRALFDIFTLQPRVKHTSFLKEIIPVQLLQAMIHMEYCVTQIGNEVRSCHYYSTSLGFLILLIIPLCMLCFICHGPNKEQG